MNDQLDHFYPRASYPTKKKKIRAKKFKSIDRNLRLINRIDCAIECIVHEQMSTNLYLDVARSKSTGPFVRKQKPKKLKIMSEMYAHRTMTNVCHRMNHNSSLLFFIFPLTKLVSLYFFGSVSFGYFILYASFCSEKVNDLYLLVHIIRTHILTFVREQQMKFISKISSHVHQLRIVMHHLVQFHGIFFFFSFQQFEFDIIEWI